MKSAVLAMTRVLEMSLFAMFSLAACGNGRMDKALEASIVDSGSTNRPGMRVTLDSSGEHVTLEPRDGEKQQTKLPEQMCKQFLRDVQAAAPLTNLPANHCMKSASFGSRLYIEFGGLRSPDLSCPEQADERAATLKKEALEILATVKNR